MKKNYLPLMLTIAILAIGCNNDQNPNPQPTEKIEKTLFKGYVEKGPFVIGSSVMIYELDNNLTQTGKCFTTTIGDNTGAFEQRDLQLSSQYVELKADGYYFNEVEGYVTESPITLYAIADIKDVDNVNVNLLTTIERQRILYLVKEENFTFSDARDKAHTEVLSIFGMNEELVENSDQLSLNKDAQLLTISAIVQGFRTPSEVTSLIASLAGDLREDGTVENTALTSAFMNGFHGLQADYIIANLEQQQINVDYTADDVQKWLDKFAQNTAYEQTEFIEYPATASGYTNLLNQDVTRLHYRANVFLGAITPKGVNLRVDIHSSAEYLMVALPAPNNWIGTTIQLSYDEEEQTIWYDNSFEVENPGGESVALLGVDSPGTMTLTIYEYNSPTPTRIQTIEFYE